MKCVVIGAGVVGLSTALALQERGHLVIVVERRNGVGRETSFANASLLTPAMSDPWTGPGALRQLAASCLGRRSAMRLDPFQIPRLIPWGARFLAASTSRAETTAANYRLARFSLDRTVSLGSRHGLRFDRVRTGSLNGTSISVAFGSRSLTAVDFPALRAGRRAGYLCETAVNSNHGRTAVRGCPSVVGRTPLPSPASTRPSEALLHGHVVARKLGLPRDRRRCRGAEHSVGPAGARPSRDRGRASQRCRQRRNEQCFASPR